MTGLVGERGRERKGGRLDRWGEGTSCTGQKTLRTFVAFDWGPQTAYQPTIATRPSLSDRRFSPPPRSLPHLILISVVHFNAKWVIHVRDPPTLHCETTCTPKPQLIGWGQTVPKAFPNSVNGNHFTRPVTPREASQHFPPSIGFRNFSFLESATSVPLFSCHVRRPCMKLPLPL